ncbi:MAG TPA: exosortase system-associated protein, TIGR04073 family [Planctomycetota bacterium]|nr:exosortase system-associated protein, TIGR04073 family [Planctomycetota bacterium]
MRRVLVVAVLLFAVSAPLLAQEPAVPAQPTEEEGPRFTIFTKLFRGIGNIIIAPFEIPVTAFNVAADTDVFIGVSVGSVAGAAAGCERLGCGVMDVITFLFPPYDRPLLTYTVGKSPAGAAAINTFPREL